MYYSNALFGLLNLNVVSSFNYLSQTIQKSSTIVETAYANTCINNHQPSSTSSMSVNFINFINHHQPSSSFINLHQHSTSLPFMHQPSSYFSNLIQTSSTFTNFHQSSSTFFEILHSSTSIDIHHPLNVGISYPRYPCATYNASALSNPIACPPLLA